VHTSGTSTLRKDRTFVETGCRVAEKTPCGYSEVRSDLAG